MSLKQRVTAEERDAITWLESDLDWACGVARTYRHRWEEYGLISYLTNGGEAIENEEEDSEDDEEGGGGPGCIRSMIGIERDCHQYQDYANPGVMIDALSGKACTVRWRTAGRLGTDRRSTYAYQCGRCYDMNYSRCAEHPMPTKAEADKAAREQFEARQAQRQEQRDRSFEPGGLVASPTPTNREQWADIFARARAMSFDAEQSREYTNDAGVLVRESLRSVYVQNEDQWEHLGTTTDVDPFANYAVLDVDMTMSQYNNLTRFWTAAEREEVTIYRAEDAD